MRVIEGVFINYLKRKQTRKDTAERRSIVDLFRMNDLNRLIIPIDRIPCILIHNTSKCIFHTRGNIFDEKNFILDLLYVY